MNKKGISVVVVAIIVIAVIVVGVVAYYGLSGGGGNEGGGNGIAEAKSLTFDVNANIGGVEEFDKFTVKNLDTADVWLRVDQVDSQGNAFIYIMKQAGQEAWANFGGEWTDVSSDYLTYADNTLIGYVALDGYVQELENWSGTGDYDFTHNGDSFVISNIFVDPEVPDSVFSPE